MKNVSIGLVLGVLFTMSVGAYYALDTYHCDLLLLRAEADEDASTIDLTTEGDFAQKPTSAVQLKPREDRLGHGGNALELVFCGGSAADKTFTYKVYAWRRTNGPARMVATGTGTLGTQAVVKYPHSAATATSKFWADTLTVTERWVASVESSDASGNNEIASLQFDFSGYEWIWVEITSADGATGTEASDVSVYYSYL